MLNPEFWLDEEIASLSPYARLLYMGLWGICDDNYATLPNQAGWIKAQIFPYEEVDTRRLLDELSNKGKLILFVSDGKEFWFIKNFFKYQTIDRPSKPKYPEYTPTLAEGSTSTRPEVKLKEVKLNGTDVPLRVEEENPRKKKDTSYFAVFDLFSKRKQGWMAHKPQIEAAKRLLELRGIDNIKAAVGFYLEHKGEKYLPEIHTPFDLEAKWPKLFAFKERV